MSMFTLQYVGCLDTENDYGSLASYPGHVGGEKCGLGMRLMVVLLPVPHCISELHISYR